MNKHAFKISMTALSVAAALGLSGCLNSSSSDDPATATTTSKSTQGVITGFGSVFVNGVEYETDNATISVDGAAGNETGLQLGMVVNLKGEVNADGSTGHALSIEFADDLEGPVGTNNIDVDNTLIVMGQTVSVTADTIFESYDALQLSPADIAAGNIVEVSGFTSGDGNIFATRIEVKKAALKAGDEIEIKGVISGLGTDTTSFTLGGMTVDYSGASEVPASIANGLYVEAKASNAPAGGIFTATKVEVEGDGDMEIEVEAGEDLELFGLVTDVGATSADGLSVDFTINGQDVRLTVENIEDMSEEVAKLTLGAKVRVEGDVDANGLLIVDEIKQGMDSDLEFEAYVDSVDVANQSVTVLGQTIYLNNYTVVYDDLDMGAERFFGVDDLVAGDWVEVKMAIDETTGQYIATKLERDDNSDMDPESIEGEIIANSNGSMILGNPDLTDPTLYALDLDVSDVINANNFLVDDKVVIEVRENGGALTVISITLD